MTELTLVTLYSADIAAARRFYTDILQLEPVREEPDFVALRCGRVLLTIHSLAHGGDAPTKTLLIFEVDDLDRFTRRAEALHLGAERRTLRGIEQLRLRDSDGNDVYLEPARAPA